MNKNILTAVGLGPGDPELISIKGLNVLNNADVIYYPATKISANEIISFSLTILQQLNLNINLKPLLIPMKSKMRLKYYNTAYLQIKSDIETGCNVVVVSEGDLLFYSTFAYLLKLAKQDNIECKIIPGIPAFIAAGALSATSIVESNNNFNVIALPDSFKCLHNAIKTNSTLVIMKLSVLNGWFEFLSSINNQFFYAEFLGTDKQYYTTNIKDLLDRDIPYFSILIIYDK